jgi:hypothetical protein
MGTVMESFINSNGITLIQLGSYDTIRSYVQVDIPRRDNSGRRVSHDTYMAGNLMRNEEQFEPN